MESNHASDGDPVAAGTPDVDRIPAVVDWFVGAIVALAGLGLFVGGGAVLFVIDRPEFASAIADATVRGDFLTEAELTQVGLTTGTWTGVGLVLTGLLMVAGAVAYVVLRRRTHARAEAGEPTEDFWANAVVGAVVSVILGFLPFSPAIGGGVAGYFERGESERTLSVGALSGLSAAIPLLAIVASLMGGITAGLFGVGEGAIGLVVLGALFIALMIIALIGAGLGGLGGYLGGKLAED